MSDAKKIVKIVGDRDKEGYEFNTNQPIKSWRQYREQIIKLCSPVATASQTDVLQEFMPDEEPEICFLLTNPVILFETQSIQFDIYAKSSIVGVKFSDANLNVKYPSDIFGTNVTQNNNIQVQKQNITADAAYQLSVQDVSSEKFNIAVGTNCKKYDSAYTLSTDYEKLVRVTIQVENWANLLNWQSGSIESDGIAKYFQSKDRCVDFRKICFEYKLNFNSCVVNSVEVAPFGAGILQTITIKGNGFGGNLGQNPLAKIDIPYAEDGGVTNIVLSGADQDYVVNWQDDEITLRISSMIFGGDAQTMGSGVWEIYPNFILGEDFCPVVVDIDYALQNAQEDGVEKMVGLAQNPFIIPYVALELYIDNGIDTDPVLQANGITFAMVQQVAQQVFCDWETAVGLEFRYMGPLNNANNNTDNKNALFFGNPGGSALAKTTTVITNGLVTNDPIFRERMVEFNINIDKQRNWYVSTNSTVGFNQYDLYSVLSHEIGHGILLKHAMDVDETNATYDDRIMYWSLVNSQTKRNIDSKTISGVELLRDRTIQSIDDPVGCFNGYDLNIYPDGCMTPTFEVITPLCDVRVSTLRKVDEGISIVFENSNTNQVRLFNATGQLVYQAQHSTSNATVPTNGLVQGIYFLQYDCNGRKFIEKIILHQ